MFGEQGTGMRDADVIPIYVLHGITQRPDEFLVLHSECGGERR